MVIIETLGFNITCIYELNTLKVDNILIIYHEVKIFGETINKTIVNNYE